MALGAQDLDLVIRIRFIANEVLARMQKINRAFDTVGGKARFLSKVWNQSARDAQAAARKTEAALGSLNKRLLQHTRNIDKKRERSKLAAAEEKQIYAQMERLQKESLAVAERVEQAKVRLKLAASQTAISAAQKELAAEVRTQEAIQKELAQTYAMKQRLARLAAGSQVASQAIASEKVAQQALQQDIARTTSLLARQNQVAAARTRFESGVGAGVAGATAMSSYGEMIRTLPSRVVSLGKNVQWTGRQIFYNLSLPIIALGAYAVATALKIERSWANMRKVFDGTAKELAALEKPALALSNRFGKPLEEQIDVMKEWARLGMTSAKEIHKWSELVNETAILFDTNLASAFDTVRSLMLSFNLTVEETRQQLANLDKIADQTAASESGIATWIKQLSGLIKTMRIMPREMGAFEAAMEGRGIKPSEGAQAFKFATLRLFNPEGDRNLAALNELLVKTKLNTTGDKWQSMGGSERWVEIAKSYEKIRTESGMTEAQIKKSLNTYEKNGQVFKSNNKQLNEFMTLLSMVVGKRQFSRIVAMIDDMANAFDKDTKSVSQWQDAMIATQDPNETMARWFKKVNEYLASQPVTWDRLMMVLRNTAYVMGKELLPAVMSVAEWLSKKAEGFQKLDPALRNMIYKIALFVAVLGPAMTIFGAFIQLFGVLTMPVKLAGLAIQGFGTIVKITLTSLTSFKALTTGLATGLSFLSGGILTVVGGLAGFYALKEILNNWSKWSDLIKDVSDSLGVLWGELSKIQDKWGKEWKDLPLGDKIVKSLEEAGAKVKAWWHGDLPKQLTSGKELATRFSKLTGEALGAGLADAMNFLIGEKSQGVEGAGKKAGQNILGSFGTGLSEGFNTNVQDLVKSKLGFGKNIAAGALATSLLMKVPLPITFIVTAAFAWEAFSAKNNKEFDAEIKSFKIALSIALAASLGLAFFTKKPGMFKYVLPLTFVIKPVLEWVPETLSGIKDNWADLLGKGNKQKETQKEYEKWLGGPSKGLIPSGGPISVRPEIEFTEPKFKVDKLTTFSRNLLTDIFKPGVAHAAELPKSTASMEFPVNISLESLKGLEGQMAQWATRINDRAAKWGRNMLWNYSQGIGQKINLPTNQFALIENALLSVATRINNRAAKWGRNMIWNYSNGMKQGTQQQLPAMSGAVQAVGDPTTPGSLGQRLTDKIGVASIPTKRGGSVTAAAKGLNGSFAQKFSNYAAWVWQNYGVKLNINSGFRTRAQQAALYRAKPGLAAPPGKSWHEKGLAIDFGPTGPWNKALSMFGLYNPMPKKEPWHIQPAGIGDPVASTGSYVFSPGDAQQLKILKEQKEELNRISRLRQAELNTLVKQLIVQRSQVKIAGTNKTVEGAKLRAAEISAQIQKLNLQKQTKGITLSTLDSIGSKITALKKEKINLDLAIKRSTVGTTGKPTQYQSLSAQIQQMQLLKTQEREGIVERLTLLDEEIDTLEDKKAVVQQIVDLQSELVERITQKFDLASSAVKYFDSTVEMLSDHSKAYELTAKSFAASMKGIAMEMALLGAQGNQLGANLAKSISLGFPAEKILEAKQSILDFGSAFVGVINDMYSRAKGRMDKWLDEQTKVIDKEQELWRTSYDTRLKDMNKFYDDQLKALDKQQGAISRTRWMSDKREDISGLQAEFTKIEGKGFFTYEDIDQMNQLRTQMAQGERDILRQQEDWVLEDKRTELEELRSLAQEGYDKELEDKDKYFDDLKQQAQDSHRRQLDILIVSMQNQVAAVGAAMTRLLSGQQVDMATWQSIISSSLGSIEGSFSSFGINLGELGWGAGQNFINQLMSAMSNTSISGGGSTSSGSISSNITAGMDLRSALEDVYWDEATREVVVNGRRFKVGTIPGTRYSGGTHTITDPDAFKKAVGLLHSGGSVKREGMVYVRPDEVMVNPPLVKKLDAFLSGAENRTNNGSVDKLDVTITIKIQGDPTKWSRSDLQTLGESVAPIIAKEIKNVSDAKVRI